MGGVSPTETSTTPCRQHLQRLGSDFPRNLGDGFRYEFHALITLFGVPDAHTGRRRLFFANHEHVGNFRQLGVPNLGTDFFG